MSGILTCLLSNGQKRDYDMLERLKRLAIRLAPIRQLILLLAFLALIAMAYVLATSGTQAEDIYLIPSLVLFIWSLTVYSFLGIFSGISPTPISGQTLLRRLLMRVKRFFYYLLLALFAAMSLFLVVTSWQLAGAWRMMY
jgi:hypothetical protein